MVGCLTVKGSTPVWRTLFSEKLVSLTDKHLSHSYMYNMLFGNLADLWSALRSNVLTINCHFWTFYRNLQQPAHQSCKISNWLKILDLEACIFGQMEWLAHCSDSMASEIKTSNVYSNVNKNNQYIQTMQMVCVIKMTSYLIIIDLKVCHAEIDELNINKWCRWMMS